MKVTIDIECTPQEARSFFGLPDIAPLQQEVLERLQEQMLKNIEVLDPVAVWKSWFPATSQGLEELRKAFAGAARAAGGKERAGGE